MALNPTLPAYPSKLYNFDPNKLAKSSMASQDAYLKELRYQQKLAGDANARNVGLVGSWYDRLRDMTQAQRDSANSYNTSMLANADAANQSLVGFMGRSNPEAADLGMYGSISRNNLAGQGLNESNYLSNMIPAVEQTGIDARRGLQRQGKQEQKTFATQLLNAARERDQGYYKNLYDAIDAKRQAYNDYGSYETVRQLLPYQIAQADASVGQTTASTAATNASTKATLAGIGLTNAQVKKLQEEAVDQSQKAWGKLTAADFNDIAKYVMGALSWEGGKVPTVSTRVTDANGRVIPGQTKNVSMSSRQAYERLLRVLGTLNPNWMADSGAQGWARNLLKTMYGGPHTRWPFLYPNG